MSFCFRSLTLYLITGTILTPSFYAELTAVSAKPEPGNLPQGSDSVEGGMQLFFVPLPLRYRDKGGGNAWRGQSIFHLNGDVLGQEITTG